MFIFILSLNFLFSSRAKHPVKIHVWAGISCRGATATVGDKIKFPLCTDSPPTCERSCQQKSPKSRPKVASDFRRTLTYFYPGKKLSARVFSSDPSREHAQIEQEEAAIILIRERYFIVYLHSMSLAVVCFGELD